MSFCLNDCWFYSFSFVALPINLDRALYFPSVGVWGLTFPSRIIYMHVQKMCTCSVAAQNPMQAFALKSVLILRRYLPRDFRHAEQAYPLYITCIHLYQQRPVLYSLTLTAGSCIIRTQSPLIPLLCLTDIEQGTDSVLSRLGVPFQLRPYEVQDSVRPLEGVWQTVCIFRASIWYSRTHVFIYSCYKSQSHWGWMPPLVMKQIIVLFFESSLFSISIDFKSSSMDYFFPRGRKDNTCAAPQLASYEENYVRVIDRFHTNGSLIKYWTAPWHWKREITTLMFLTGDKWHQCHGG